MAAKWPTTTATDADLSIASNSLQTTLASGIDGVTATIPLTSTSGFPAAGYVTIDNEVLSYAGVSGGNLTGAVRGADGTSGAAHLAAAPVSATIVAAHHNSLKDEVKAVEGWLDTVLGKATTVTNTVFGYLVGVTSSIQTQITGVTTTANAALPKTGGTMSSAIAMGANKVTGLASATASGDALSFGQAFTSGNHTFNPTTAGIVGTPTNDNAAAGNVGEYVRGYASAVAASQVGGIYVNIVSISLTAGDWDVSGVVNSGMGSNVLPTNVVFALSQFSGNTQTDFVYGDNVMEINVPVYAISNKGGSISAWRVSKATTGSVYLKGYIACSGGSPTFDGRISARRIR